MTACAGGDSTTPTPPARVATTVQVTTAGGNSLPAGGTAQLNAIVLDQNGTAMPGAPVSFSVEPTEMGTVTSAGLFASSGRLGTATARASSGSASAALQFTVTVGPAAKLLKVSGDSQSVTSGSPLAAPLVVRVTDAYDNPISAASVSWSIVGSSSSPTTISTGADGRAGASFTAGSTVQTTVIQASVVGSSVTAISFRIFVLPSRGSLRLSTTGLPDGVFLSPKVRDQNGQTSSVPFTTPGSQVLNLLIPGPYTITWDTVTTTLFDGDRYAPATRVQSVNLAASVDPTPIVMQYTLITGRLELRQTGLPIGAFLGGTIVGPPGFTTKTFLATQPAAIPVGELPPGTYTIVFNSTFAAGKNWSPSPAQVQVQVTASTTPVLVETVFH